MTMILYGLIERRSDHPLLGEPFYIGVGTHSRPHVHFRNARSTKGHLNAAVQVIFDGHFAAGTEPDIRVFATFDVREEAFEAERRAIAFYGRIDVTPNGILCNVTSGGQGLGPESIRKRMQSPGYAESMALMAAAAKRMWEDPDTRARLTESRKAAWQDPEKRANMLEGRSETQTELWKNPEVREKRTEAVRSAIVDKWANDPEYAERARAGLRAAWQDPVKKAERVAKMLASRAAKGTTRTPEARAKQAEVMRAVNAAKSTESRAAAQAGAWSDPEKRKRMSEALKQSAQDPELKARRLAAMAAGKRRKAAEHAALPLQVAE